MNTTEPRPAPANKSAIPLEQDASWVRLPIQGQSLCGLQRSFLYQLVAKRLIRSIKLNPANTRRGVLLIYRPSIHSFLESLDFEQNGKPAAK